MTTVSLVVYTIIMLGLLLFIEKDDNPGRRTVVKALTSSGFVALGLVRFQGSTLDIWLLAALILGALGDVLLAAERTFDLGLVSFLADHILLIVAFCSVLSFRSWPLALLAPIAIPGIAVLTWLWPHLGRRTGPVSAYIAAITLMVWGAMSVVVAGSLPWWVAVAAALFMLSDIAVARQRFVTGDHRNRLIGLPMYYAAQLLFAFLIGR